MVYVNHVYTVIVYTVKGKNGGVSWKQESKEGWN